jgi:hypothetical protein
VKDAPSGSLKATSNFVGWGLESFTTRTCSRKEVSFSEANTSLMILFELTSMRLRGLRWTVSAGSRAS